MFNSPTTTQLRKLLAPSTMQNADYSGTNILMMGIFYEALQRCAGGSCGGRVDGWTGRRTVAWVDRPWQLRPCHACHTAVVCFPCNGCSWVGDATRVVALAKVVTHTRLDTEAAALTGVRVPDHVDVLADMASGDVMRFPVSLWLAARKVQGRA